MKSIPRLTYKKPFNYSQEEVLKARRRCIIDLSTLIIFCPSELGLVRSELLRYREAIRAFGLDIVDCYEDRV